MGPQIGGISQFSPTKNIFSTFLDVLNVFERKKKFRLRVTRLRVPASLLVETAFSSASPVAAFRAISDIFDASD